MIVLDASAALDLVLRTTEGDAIRLRARDEEVVAPHVIDVEIANALRRAARNMGAARGSEAIQDWLLYPAQRFPHVGLLPRAWELRNNFTAYDAVYIALAEILDAPLVTRDAKLVSPLHGARVELF